MKFWILCISIVVFIVAAMFAHLQLQKESIKIGLLYSASGTMATSEIPVANIVRAAIKELNDNGGILGQEVQLLEFDGKSDPLLFAKGAQELIDQGAISLFGCWTSASRKEVKKVVEQNNNVLFYPVQYEGLESSPNIVYLGLSANQQINPTLDFIQSHFGKRVYLVGSEYIYPKAANFYIKELSRLSEFEVIAERYIPLGSNNFGDLFEDILAKKPHAIINTLNGDSNIDFFLGLQRHAIAAKDIPVFSLSLDESLLAPMQATTHPHAMSGHYAAWGYFNIMNENKTNRFTLFLERYFQEHEEITDAMFSAYIGVQLFKESLNKAQDATPQAVLTHIKRKSFYLSGNIYFIDPKNLHTHRHVMIGKINDRARFEIVWHSPQIIKPTPYPTFKSKQEWEECLEVLTDSLECNKLLRGETDE